MPIKHHRRLFCRRKSWGCRFAGRSPPDTAEHPPGGKWSVNCVADHAKAETTCFAGTFGDDARTTFSFFQITYVNGRGPNLAVPNDYPGTVPTVRVDNGPVLSDPVRIVEALKTGATAYVVYYSWPMGEEQMTVKIGGFAAAYDALLAKVKAAPPA